MPWIQIYNLFQAYSRSCKNGEDEDEMGDADDAEPSAKASPSSLQATAETGESKSSASSDTCSRCHLTYDEKLQSSRWWGKTETVTPTLSGAWWPWICQRKACLKLSWCSSSFLWSIVVWWSLQVHLFLKSVPFFEASWNDDNDTCQNFRLQWHHQWDSRLRHQHSPRDPPEGPK